MRLYGQTLKPDQVDPQEAAKYEDDAGRYWDLFYKRNSDKFFKDRHYFDKEWPQLTQGQITVLEVGCGAGNSVFPLLDINPQSYVYACDFSPRAVELVKAHPAYTVKGRVTAFVADITQHEGAGALSQQLPGPVVDFCSMVFVLSAVAPHKMRQALRNVASVLKSGTGRVLFRDYADGDLAQTRLQDSQGVKHIRGNFYARGDGTCCYYFGQDELSALFGTEGFVCESSIIHARTIENRKTGVKMARRWIQAVFRYDPVQQPPQPLPMLEVHTHQQQDQQRQQQQQQQQQEQVSPAEGTVQGQERNGFTEVGGKRSSASDSCTRVDCAGKAWLLPSHFAAAQSSSNSSSSGIELYQSICCLAESLASLVQQQQVQVLGRCLLVAPPWLCMKQQQQQQQVGSGTGNGLQQQSQQRVVQLVAVSGQVAPQAYCLAQDSNCSSRADSSSSSSNSSSSSAEEAAQLEGAAAALLALAAVWLGARRVLVCLPDSNRDQAVAPAKAQQQQQLQQSVVQCSGAGARLDEMYVEAFHAVLALNECSVVVERVRPKRWGQRDLRRAEVLQREVVTALSRGLPACNGLVLVARAAVVPSSSSDHGSSSPSNSGCAAGVDSRAHQGAQKLIDAVFHASQAAVGGPLQVLLQC